ncbi:Serine-threonine/tyrosine-protein kinase, catalytic domain [Sesbania bispinosa]|nr:Serine-threonine/tyrosine-protein kinase, catalytic domain [Sesbania bispinosa]
MNKSSCSNKSNCVDSNKKEFTYSEVLSISNNFERVLGKGGFGTVYHGCIGETQVAVKMLSHSSQGFRQFLTEAKILTIVHHRCLTPLIGYCNEGTTLIYKYMPNGNLAEHLSDKNKLLLGWKQRLQIALDSAIGLEYLHNGCNPQIVHRDVKTSNILLDKDFREILTGKPVILKSDEYTHIIQWVNSMLATGNVIDSIMDSRLRGKYDIESARRVIDVAMACVAPSSIQRPTMNQVMIELNQCLSMENLGSASNEISMELISGESSLMR